MKFRTKKYYKNQNVLLMNELELERKENKRLTDEKDNYGELVTKLEKSLKTRENALNKAITENICYRGEIIRLREVLETKEEARRKVAGKVGGLTKENNKLNDELKKTNEKIKDLEIKLKESMSDKYLVKKIKSGKMPKGQKIGIKNSTIPSNIMRNLHKEVDNEN